jgi:phage shock protein A
MGIFSRFRDIISSNISAMLDKAEDPEKLIRLMIREMEDTLVELKASCASTMAQVKRIERQIEDARNRAQYWEEKAQLAVSKGRDDLGREALIEKKRHAERIRTLEHELSEHQVLILQYQDDIRQLEEKLGGARDKQRLLVQRHIRAITKMRAQEDIRRVNGSEAILKFEELENRIERMEASADLVNFGRKSPLDKDIEDLSTDEEIERELQAIKGTMTRKGEGIS